MACNSSGPFGGSNSMLQQRLGVLDLRHALPSRKELIVLFSIVSSFAQEKCHDRRNNQQDIPAVTNVRSRLCRAGRPDQVLHNYVYDKCHHQPKDDSAHYAEPDEAISQLALFFYFRRRGCGQFSFLSSLVGYYVARFGRSHGWPERLAFTRHSPPPNMNWMVTRPLPVPGPGENAA